MPQPSTPRSQSAGPRPARWRILRDPPASGAWNMALDVALARCLPPDEGVLRIYRWSRPTLSLGRNQPARNRYDPFAAEGLGVDVVRRPTGGREVLHDRELTYALAVPLDALGGLRAGYHTLNAALLAAVRSLGVPAAHAAANGRPAVRPADGPCFMAAAEGEIEVSGRKLVGSAQVRVGPVLLQHGSILLAAPSVDLEALLATEGEAEAGAWRGQGGAIAPGDGGPITLSEVLGRPAGFPEIAQAVEAAVAGTLGGSWRRDVPSEVERATATGLLSQFGSDSWTWRR